MTAAEMQMNQKMNVTVTLSVSMDFLHWLDAENATIGGSWTVTGVPAGQPDKGSWLAVVHKSPDGQWLLTSDLAAPFLQPPPAEAGTGASRLSGAGGRCFRILDGQQRKTSPPPERGY